jgi:hypothetical protein
VKRAKLLLFKEVRYDRIVSDATKVRGVLHVLHPDQKKDAVARIRLFSVFPPASAGLEVSRISGGW